MGPETDISVRWRIGIDIGGTFTDLALEDALENAGGLLEVLKVPSTPGNPGAGVLDGLHLVAQRLGVSTERLLADCRLLVHGTTVATNTVLEGKGAKVGLLTTAGFRDSLEIRRGVREDQWDHRRPFAPVLVPRFLRRPVRGRLDRDGVEVEPLELADVEAAAALFEQEGVESVAVCLLHSYRNGEHEEAVLRCLQACGFEWVSLSSRVVPVIGEYARSSTTVLNAAVAPVVVPYLERLQQRLQELGLDREMLLLQSNGGAATVAQLRERPVQLLLSGPAAGVGALGLLARDTGERNLIAMEVGGTSCDVTLVESGRVATTESLSVGGYDVASAAIDIHSVGAGGGTIATVDSGGLLQVGPRGAGADPGPACYGRGGTAATVADAQLVLGRLRAGPYADGAVVLDADLARAAIEREVALPLGIPVEAAALGIVRVLDQHLAQAVEEVSLARGIDPRRFVLVAAGGSGPLHAVAVARRLGCRGILVPRHAGVFCALGMLGADMRLDRHEVHLQPLEEADPAELEGHWQELERPLREQLRQEGFVPAAIEMQRRLTLRYRGQLGSLEVAWRDEGSDAARADFEREHQRLYGHIQPGGSIEVTALRAAAVGRLVEDHSAPAASPELGQEAMLAPPATGSRAVLFDETEGWVAVPLVEGPVLQPGNLLEGPAVIEDETTTVLLEAGNEARVDATGHLHIMLGPSPLKARPGA